MNERIGKPKIFSLGLQHVLAMYAGAILVPLIVGGALKFTPHQQAFLIAIDLLTCGIATLLQSINNPNQSSIVTMNNSSIILVLYIW